MRARCPRRACDGSVYGLSLARRLLLYAAAAALRLCRHMMSSPMGRIKLRAPAAPQCAAARLCNATGGCIYPSPRHLAGRCGVRGGRRQRGGEVRHAARHASRLRARGAAPRGADGARRRRAARCKGPELDAGGLHLRRAPAGGRRPGGELHARVERAVGRLWTRVASHGGAAALHVHHGASRRHTWQA